MNTPAEPPENRPSLLLVEDDELLAGSLVPGLQEAGFDVRGARHCQAALLELERDPPDLILLDLGLPDADGLTLLRHLRSKHPTLPVIITTARSSVENRVEGLSEGADDYLVKPYDFGELLARIRVQLRHAQRMPIQETIADLTVDRATHRVLRGSETIELSPKEFDLLNYLISLRGGVASRDMLAHDVWHIRSRMTSMDNIIDVHVSRLRQKLDKHRSVPLIQTIRGVGYALREPA